MTIEHLKIPPGQRLHSKRGNDLTMSNVGAVIGVDRFRTPFDIWAEKAGLAAPPEENSAMVLGRWCEPAVVAAHRELYPDIHIDYPLNLYVRCPELRLGGTPDGTGFHIDRPDERIVFEFKVISRQSYERNWIGGEAPLSYQLQTLGNAMLLDAHHGILAALVLGWQDAELVVRRYQRHARAEARIREIARRFWTAFDEGHAPQPDYTRDAETIRQVFRPDAQKPAPIDLSQDNRIFALLERRETLNENLRKENAEIKAIKAEIIHKLDGAESAVAGDWKIVQYPVHVAERMAAAYDYIDMRVTKAKENRA